MYKKILVPCGLAGSAPDVRRCSIFELLNLFAPKLSNVKAFDPAMTQPFLINTMKCVENQYERFQKQFDLVFYVNLFFGALKWIAASFHEYSLVIALSVISVIVLYLTYRSYINPELYKKELTEVGYTHIPPSPDRGLRIMRAQAARRLGAKIPSPYPNGWFAVAESSEVKIGGVLAVDALGQNLCVYRGSDGIARCVDAYCPHLGAHLAIGGNVRGDCIECPFHKWRFGPDGALNSVPQLETVPKGVSIKLWNTVEADGAIWIWHDADDRPPQWPLQDAPELASYAYRGRNEFYVSCHIQEIPENGADVAHLNAVHSTSLISQLGEKYPILLNVIGRHYWSAEWTKGEDHTSSIKLTHDYKVMKKNLLHIDVNVTQIGPGHVRLRLRTPCGPVLISQSVTPAAPLLQKVVHRIYTPWYNAFVGVVLNRAESYQFERDVAIWNSKRYVTAPAYVKTDRTIRAFRAWYSQFYSEHSKSFAEAHNRGIEW